MPRFQIIEKQIVVFTYKWEIEAPSKDEIDNEVSVPINATLTKDTIGSEMIITCLHKNNDGKTCHDCKEEISNGIV